MFPSPRLHLLIRDGATEPLTPVSLIRRVWSGSFCLCPLLWVSAASDLAPQWFAPYIRWFVCVSVCSSCAEVLITLLLSAPKLIDSDESLNLSDPGFEIFDACVPIRRLTLRRSSARSPFFHGGYGVVGFGFNLW